jgi:suppressor for copper-sensitivity B
LAASLLALLVALAGARADTLPDDLNELGRVRLIAATTAVGELQTVPIGLQFELAPGWKTYWRSPGDAGFPARLDWAGSENLADARIKWPLPERFSILGLETLGYEDRVVLPIDATLREPGKPLSLALKVDWLVCKEVCIPLSTALQLDLSAGPAQPSQDAHDIDRFNARVPSRATAAGLAIESVESEGLGQSARLIVGARADLAFLHPDLFIEGPREFGFGQPRVSLADGGRYARLVIPVSGPDGASLAGADLRLTLADGARALEATHRAASTSPLAGGLAAMLAVALLGGLILNLMPCVLPVLSLKLLQVVGHGGADPRLTRRAFLASAAGIVFSFMMLALGAILLRQAGQSVGWGMQFQEPAFLVFMIGLLLVFAAHLAGLIHIRLPGALMDRLAAEHGSGLVGHFLSGAFATLLATPCSAPFVGSALGFALSRGPLEIVSIFAMLGLGLALPYLMIAAFPKLATRLPRPGSWMVWLERALALALVATALWLGAVLTSEAGLAASLIVLALVAASLAAVMMMPARIAAPAAAVLIAAALAVPYRMAGAGPQQADAIADARWQAFSPALLGRLVGESKVVLVDVTADWCITCQVNKRLVLSSDKIRQLLDEPGVVALRADWTRPDPAIADYLASHGRYGIPFNAVYGPSAPDGVPLPELLSEDAVTAAFERAGRPKLAAGTN